MKIQEEIISSFGDNVENGKILFEETSDRSIFSENDYRIEAAKKRKSKNDDDDEDFVDDDDYYTDDEEDDNPFDKEPDEGDLLDDEFPIDDDDLFDDDEDDYR